MGTVSEKVRFAESTGKMLKNLADQHSPTVKLT